MAYAINAKNGARYCRLRLLRTRDYVDLLHVLRGFDTLIDLISVDELVQLATS